VNAVGQGGAGIHIVLCITLMDGEVTLVMHVWVMEPSQGGLCTRICSYSELSVCVPRVHEDKQAARAGLIATSED